MRQGRFGLFGCARRLHRIVAVCGQYPVKNCRVGSCISVAFQFLGFQNRNRSFEFCRGLWLFLPKAVLYLLVCPANASSFRMPLRRSGSVAWL
jgi:hypothetical protein